MTSREDHGHQLARAAVCTSSCKGSRCTSVVLLFDLTVCFLTNQVKVIIDSFSSISLLSRLLDVSAKLYLLKRIRRVPQRHQSIVCSRTNLLVTRRIECCTEFRARTSNNKAQ